MSTAKGGNRIGFLPLIMYMVFESRFFESVNGFLSKKMFHEVVCAPLDEVGVSRDIVIAARKSQKVKILIASDESIHQAQ